MPTMISYLWTTWVTQSVEESHNELPQPYEILIVLSSVVMLVTEAMLFLRVYAVYKGNWSILGLVLFGWVAHFVTIIVAFFMKDAIVYDFIIGMLLTVGLYHKNRATVPLIKLIIRDGVIYLAIVLASNMIWALAGVILVDPLIPSQDFVEVPFTVLVIWSACITTTMIGRLNLNIRRYVDRPSPIIGLDVGM
ncbi:hypothetical protein BDZ94DRAFT_1238750 [Collybia nuda]|uniref:Uncharacterized protein n=1 Tax=Collybia nuda TaxID=64659 RepID=A0A9P6CGJ5_9AGAR|nr:hypothetical protein BDZ94DRAFT_1238750 [Collybia nuda]